VSGDGGDSPSTLRHDTQRALPFAALSGAMQIVLSLVGMLLLVRYLPPDLYGVWVILLGFTVPIILFTSLGFRNSLLRFLPATETRALQRRFLWSVLFRRALVAFLACIAMGLAFPLFAERLGIAGHGRAFTALLPGYLFLDMSHYMMVGLNTAFRQREVFLGSLFFQIVSVAGVVSGIYLKEDLLYFAVVYSFATLAYLAFNMVVTSHFFGRPQWQDFTRRHFENPEEKKYRRASFLDDVGNGLLSSDVNRFILAAFSTSPQVAVYAVASTIILRLRALVPIWLFRPLVTVIFFKRFEESGSIDEVNRMFSFVFALNRVVTTAFLILFIPLGQETLVWVFREDYVSSYLPMVFLFFSMGFLTMPVGLVAQAVRRPEWLVYSKVAVLVNIGLGIPFAMMYGALGMAAVAAISELVKSLIVFVLLRMEFGIRYPWKGTFRFLLAGGAVCTGLWWIQGYVPLLVAGGIGLIVWLIAVRYCGVLTRDEKRLLVSLAPERFQPMLTTFAGT
jgi:O-antigen/teichoic acid export membrane protein